MLDIGYAGSLLGGMATILSPCSAMLLPAFFAYAFGSAQTLILRTAVFWLGLLVTLVPMGVAAGSFGALFAEHRSTFILVAASVVVVLGLVQALGIPIPLLAPRAARGTSLVAVFALGTVYGVAGSCSGPILGSVLAVAALGQDPVRGGVLLGIFSLGMVVPLLVLALLWDVLDLGARQWLRPRPLHWGPIRTTLGQLLAGLLFVAIGVLMLLTDGLADLGGIFDARTQQRLEVDLMGWAAGVGDAIAVVLILLVVIAAVAAHMLASSRRG